MKKITLLILTVCAVFAAADASAQALWRRNGGASSMYDMKAPEVNAWKVHDTVLIKINENTKANVNDKFEIKKDAKLDAGLTNYIKLGNNFNVLPGDGRDLNIKSDATYETQNEGKRGRRSTFSDTIMAEVTEVMPGYDPEKGRGNLMIRAFKQVAVREDIQRVALTGRIDVQDIMKDRSISGARIFDLKLELSGEGDVSDNASQGWLSKILTTLWPF